MAGCVARVMNLILFLSLATSSLATVYTVGDSIGWVPNMDYYTWVNSRTFSRGDVLVFNYPTGKGHIATEVDQSAFITCNGTNAIFSNDSGHTSITLNSAGRHFFISAGPGDCNSGMEFPLDVK